MAWLRATDFRPTIPASVRRQHLAPLLDLAYPQPLLTDRPSLSLSQSQGQSHLRPFRVKYSSVRITCIVERDVIWIFKGRDSPPHLPISSILPARRMAAILRINEITSFYGRFLSYVPLNVKWNVCMVSSIKESTRGCPATDRDGTFHPRCDNRSVIVWQQTKLVDSSCLFFRSSHPWR